MVAARARAQKRVAHSVFHGVIVLMAMLGSLEVAQAHGPRPEVVGLTLSGVGNDAVHALTSNQGVFAQHDGQYRWVCEDAVYPFAKTHSLILSGEAEQRWLVATNYGLHVSTDGGCDFAPVEHALGTTRVAGAWRQPDAEGIVVLEANVDGPNDVLLSTDEGETWRTITGPVRGTFRSFHWLGGTGGAFLIRTDSHLQRGHLDEETLIDLEIQVAGLQIPLSEVMTLTVSPRLDEELLVSVRVGERSRILRSGDGGLTWRDSALLDEPEVSLLFLQDQDMVLAAGRAGGRWLSADGGRTFAEEGSSPISLGCLTPGPEGRLYGCANPNQGGPWVIGMSGDSGRTWMPLLERFEDTVHRKDCARDGRTYLCCRGRCPGDAMTCGQPTFVEWPTECYEGADPALFPDGGGPDPNAADAGLDGGGGDDLSVVPDSGRRLNRTDSGLVDAEGGRNDGQPDGMSARSGETSGSEGCSTHGARASGWTLLLLGWCLFRTRRSQGR